MDPEAFRVRPTLFALPYIAWLTLRTFGPHQRTAIYQLQTVFHGLEVSRQSYLDPKMLIETLKIESDLQQDAQESVLLALFLSSINPRRRVADFTRQQFIKRRFSKLFLELISQAVQNYPNGSNRKVVEEQVRLSPFLRSGVRFLS